LKEPIVREKKRNHSRKKKTPKRSSWNLDKKKRKNTKEAKCGGIYSDQSKVKERPLNNTNGRKEMNCKSE